MNWFIVLVVSNSISVIVGTLVGYALAGLFTNRESESNPDTT